MHGAIAEMAAGFADPVHYARMTFRATLYAMARPGRVFDAETVLAPPAPLGPVAGAVTLGLIDSDTPVWLDTVLRTAAVEDYLRFHTGCPVTDDQGRAAFGLIADLANLPDLDDFSFGSPEYPDRSTTLVIQVDALVPGRGACFTGPGIETGRWMAAAPLDDDFWRAAQRNNARFPLGLDFIFTTDGAVAACPRSTAVAIMDVPGSDYAEH